MSSYRSARKVLPEMKITDIVVHTVSVGAHVPEFKWRAGLQGSEGPHVGGWLAIHTDAGITGYAYSNRGLILDDLVNRRIRDDFVGQDPTQRELLWHRMWELDRVEEFPIYAIGVVDIALWDIAGKAAGMPVHALLGGFRTSIQAYASTTTFSSIEEYMDIADQCIDLGFSAIKLHAFGDARTDAKLSVALRERVGDEMVLMYDGSAGFDLLDATFLGHALDDAGFTYYEEPMREFSIHAYQQLARRVRVPLLVAETSDGAHMNTADFIASGCATAVRTSASLRGGITGAMRIAHLADSFLLRAEVHGAGLVNRHLCMAISNNTYYESFVNSNPAAREAVVDEHGYVHAPQAPGIGWESEGPSDVPGGFPGVSS